MTRWKVPFHNGRAPDNKLACARRYQRGDISMFTVSNYFQVKLYSFLSEKGDALKNRKHFFKATPFYYENELIYIE